MHCDLFGSLLALSVGACLSVLGETDVGGVLTEAATADVERVLADQTTARVAHTAARKKQAGVRNDTGEEGGVCERGYTRSE